LNVGVDLSEVKVNQHRPATARCSEVFDVSGVGRQSRRTHRQRARRQPLHSHHEEHSQSEEDRGKDGRVWRSGFLLLITRSSPAAVIADRTEYDVRYTGKLWYRFRLQVYERL